MRLLDYRGDGDSGVGCYVAARGTRIEVLLRSGISRLGFLGVVLMKKNPKTSFFAADPEEEKAAKDPAQKRRLKKREAPSRKTSFNPLYETTDRYRKVSKPLNVEDFLSPDP
jgi:hypothetical protein